jgi:transposase
VPSTPADIAAELAQAPACRRIVFETGRMAPMLYHGLSQLGLPVVCVESRQAYQALKLLATHKTDRNDARDCDFNQAALHPANPIKCHMST